MKKFEIITTPDAIGVVSYFSVEEGSGIVLINGSEYEFSLDGRHSVELKFHYGFMGDKDLSPYPAKIYITINSYGDIDFIPQIGDKIAILFLEKKSVAWWTSLEEFEKKATILKIVESGECPERIWAIQGGGNGSFEYIPDPAKWDRNPKLVYVEEGVAFKPQLRDIFAVMEAAREKNENVLERAINGIPKYTSEVFIIKPLMGLNDGFYFFNQNLKKYEKCEPVEVHINTLIYNQQEYPADYIFFGLRGLESNQVAGVNELGDFSEVHSNFNLGVIASPTELFPIVTGYMSVRYGRTFFSSLRRRLIYYSGGAEKFLSERGKKIKTEQFAEGQTVQFENGSSVWFTEGTPGVPGKNLFPGTFDCAIEITNDTVVVCKK